MTAMNQALPEMMHCLNAPGSCTDMTVLERQRARMKWQHELLQPQQSQPEQLDYSSGSQFSEVFSIPIQACQVPNFQSLLCGGGGSVLGEVVVGAVKPDPVLDNGWPELGKFEMANMGYGSSGLMSTDSGLELNSAISRTSSCQQAVMAAEVLEVKGRESVLSEKIKPTVGKESQSFKKRKAEKNQNTKIVAEEDSKEKRIKICAEEGESKITDQNSAKNNSTTTTNRETSADTSKENSKASEVQKPDYIHVRARRGQATDSHSLAERARREKISERMKYLQDLVPGCNKITGKAGMLDEIINYVQSLQRQVEFLSMKLATVNPRLDFNVDDLFTKEVIPSCTSNYPSIGMSTEMTNPAYLQLNPANQMVSYSGFEMGTNSSDHMELRRTISAPLSIQETFFDSSSCLAQIQPSSAWDADLQNLYNVTFDQGRSAAFPSQPYTGSVEVSNLKMEM